MTQENPEIEIVKGTSPDHDVMIEPVKTDTGQQPNDSSPKPADIVKQADTDLNVANDVKEQADKVKTKYGSTGAETINTAVTNANKVADESGAKAQAVIDLNNARKSDTYKSLEATRAGDPNGDLSLEQVTKYLASIEKLKSSGTPLNETQLIQEVWLNDRKDALEKAAASAPISTSSQQQTGGETNKVVDLSNANDGFDTNTYGKFSDEDINSYINSDEYSKDRNYHKYYTATVANDEELSNSIQEIQNEIDKYLTEEKTKGNNEHLKSLYAYKKILQDEADYRKSVGRKVDEDGKLYLKGKEDVEHLMSAYKNGMDSFGGNHKLYNQIANVSDQMLENAGYTLNERFKKTDQGFFFPAMYPEGDKFYVFNPVTPNGGVISKENLDKYVEEAVKSGDVQKYDSEHDNALVGTFDTMEDANYATQEMYDMVLGYNKTVELSKKVDTGVGNQGSATTPHNPGSKEKPLAFDKNAKYEMGDIVANSSGDLYTPKGFDEEGNVTEWAPYEEPKQETKKETPEPKQKEEKKEEAPTGKVTTNATPEGGAASPDAYVPKDFSKNYDIKEQAGNFILEKGWEYAQDEKGQLYARRKEITEPFIPDYSATDAEEDAELVRRYKEQYAEAKKNAEDAIKALKSSETGMTEKVAALQALADNDKIINELSSENYLKRQKANRVAAMIADALSAVGNMIATANGGVAYKTDSATDKVAKKELQDQQTLQKRIDYWSKRLEKASTSSSASASLIRSQISAINNAFHESAVQLRSELGIEKDGLRSKRAARSANVKNVQNMILKHNAEKYKETDRSWKTVENDKKLAVSVQNNIRSNAARVEAAKLGVIGRVQVEEMRQNYEATGDPQRR